MARWGRRERERRAWIVLATLFALGCEGAPAVSDDGGAGGAIAVFDPVTAEGEALAWGAVPFPSDLHLDAQGHPRLGALPTRLGADPRFVALRALLAARRGLCGTCNVYFGIEGALDPASVPASASPADAASLDDAIVLVDVDDASPERGRVIPLRVEHDAARGRVAVRPVRGIVLRRGRRYAAAITTAIRAADGSPLAASEAFVAVRDGAGGGPDVERARRVLGPALDALDALGLPRARVASLAAFTVGDPTIDLRDARAAIHARPAPVAVVDRVWSTPAELDDLLGVPAEDRPGIDVPPAAGTEGTRAIAHSTVAAIVSGRFRAPRFVEGVGAEVGAPRRDAEGRLAAGDDEDVPFLLIVPAGVDLARLPVIVHHHGFNASRTTGFVLADTAGRAGAAVLSIDAYQHGARAASSRDELHAMRGDLAGADGLVETDTLAVSSRVFGISGVPDGMELFMGFALGAFLQFQADAIAAIRFAREGDLSAIRAALPALAGLALDPDRVMYAGNSMGAVVGVGVLAVEPAARAYVLNVQPGSILESIAEAAEFRPLAEGVFLPLLSIPPGFDEVARSTVMDPTVDLFRWALEPVDPLALAPYLFLDPVAGGARPDVLFQLASLDQLAAPPAVQSMLAAAGVPGIGTFDVVPLAAAVTPLRANLETSAGTITAAAFRFDPAAHGMLEIASQPSTHEPPLVPPLIERGEPIVVTNPIAAVHAQIEAFFRARIEDGRAEIR